MMKCVLRIASWVLRIAYCKVLYTPDAIRITHDSIRIGKGSIGLWNKKELQSKYRVDKLF
jgi:hypothetical protein